MPKPLMRKSLDNTRSQEIVKSQKAVCLDDKRPEIVSLTCCSHRVKPLHMNSLLKWVLYNNKWEETTAGIRKNKIRVIIKRSQDANKIKTSGQIDRTLAEIRRTKASNCGSASLKNQCFCGRIWWPMNQLTIYLLAQLICSADRYDHE